MVFIELNEGCEMIYIGEIGRAVGCHMKVYCKGKNDNTTSLYVHEFNETKHVCGSSEQF